MCLPILGLVGIWGFYLLSRFQYQNDKAEALSPRQI